MSLGGLVRTGADFLRNEWRSRGAVDVSWRRRLWLYRRGFLAERDGVWDLTNATVDDYLSDRQRSRCNRLSRPYGMGLKNKVLFHRVVGRTHADLLPAVYGVVRNGDVVGDLGRANSLDDVIELVRERPVVSKPVDGSKGDAVCVIDATDDGLRIDGRPVSRRAVEAALASERDRLVEAYVEQGDYAAAVYPDATNTVRLLTMVDRNGDPFVAAAQHRFATRASGSVDNWSVRGISAGIDVDTGVLGRAAVRAPDGSGVEWLDDHPDTGTPIAGTKVPAWDRVTDAVADLAGEYGWLWPYVGWDVVVTDDAGSVTILEGNRNPGVEALQIHQPLLRDPRVRRFYERHGIV